MTGPWRLEPPARRPNPRIRCEDGRNATHVETQGGSDTPSDLAYANGTHERIGYIGAAGQLIRFHLRFFEQWSASASRCRAAIARSRL